MLPQIKYSIQAQRSAISASGSSKFDFQSIYHYNLNMNINKNRDVITLEETLAYIKYINREKPFNKDEVLIPTKDYEEVSQVNKQKVVTPKEKIKKPKIEDIDDEDLTKKINKNRAIKRIIQSAFQILQNFNNYEEDQGQQKGDKSSEIQFNIYLKQYNRVLEMIYKKEKEMLNGQTEKAEQRQQILQNIYQYTVVQDFRQILPIAVLKDKISKTNVQIMINALADNLVVLKTNQLRIYDSKTATGTPKSIKLHEIQNVDYHTQPYIFIVLTIQKDKERFNIYMRFDSEKNQEKWDRALYCCFIGRKMKTKEKFFLIQFPQQDVKKKEKEQTKKMAGFSYEVEQKKGPIDKIFNQKKTLSISDRSKDDPKDENQQNVSRSNTRGRKQSGTKSNLNRNMSVMSKQDGGNHQQLNPRDEGAGSEFGNKGTAKSNKFTLNDSESNRVLDKNDDVINRNKTDFITINKTGTPHDKDYTERNQMPFGSYSQIEEDKPQEQIEPPPIEPLPADIRRIHDLERKHVKGIVLEKEKFFFNKAKIVYLKENSQGKEKQHEKTDINSQYEAMRQRQLQYWDFDNSTGQKSERKIIKVPNIMNYMIKEDKFLVIIHENKKEISFTGDLALMKQIYEWIDLILKIIKTKL